MCSCNTRLELKAIEARTLVHVFLQHQARVLSHRSKNIGEYMFIQHKDRFLSHRSGNIGACVPARSLVQIFMQYQAIGLDHRHEGQTCWCKYSCNIRLLVCAIDMGDIDGSIHTIPGYWSLLYIWGTLVQVSMQYQAIGLCHRYGGHWCKYPCNTKLLVFAIDIEDFGASIHAISGYWSLL